MSHKTVPRIALCLALCILIRTPVHAQVSGENLTQRLLDEACIFGSIDPVTLRWEYNMSCGLSDEELAVVVETPVKSADLSQQLLVTFCWQNGMFYQHVQEEAVVYGGGANSNGTVRMTAVQESACDGDTLSTATGADEFRDALGAARTVLRESFDDLKVRSPNLSVMTAADYLQAAGWHLPVKVGEFTGQYTTVVRGLAAKEGFKVVIPEQYSGTASTEPVILVSTDSSGTETKVEVLPQNGWAIASMTQSQLGALAVEITCSDFMKPADSTVFLPQRIVVKSYLWGNRPVHKKWGKGSDAVTEEPITIETYKLLDVSTDEIPLNRFRLEYSDPRTIIADRSKAEYRQLKKGQLQYRVPADSKDLDAVIEIAKAGRHAVATPPNLDRRDSTGFRFWLVAVNVTLGLVCVVIFLYGRRKRTP